MVQLLHFIGVENSFEGREKMLFYQKYYQLLLHQKVLFKEKRLLLLGPRDSGKTSWFKPFEGK